MEGLRWCDPFPVAILSGTTSASGLNLYSFREVLLDGQVGNWTSGPTPRVGVNQLREVNNLSLSTFPTNAKATYEGEVSGQPFFSFTLGQTSSATGSGFTNSGAQATSTGQALSGSYNTISGCSITCSLSGQYLFNAQCNATITTGASGAGDYCKARLFDTTNNVNPGLEVTFAMGICENLSFTDAAPLTAVYVPPAVPFTMAVQMEIVQGASGTTATAGNCVLTVAQLK
jgi:hypothetical protein